jgi:hypothetical protein
MIIGRLLGIFWLFIFGFYDGLLYFIMSQISMLHIFVNTLYLLFPIVSVIILLKGYFHLKATGVFLAFGAIGASWIISIIIEYLYSKSQFKKIGEAHIFSEASFDVAYIQWAKLRNVNQDMSLSDSELFGWEDCRKNYEIDMKRDCTRL